jgi:uncharacterized protein YqgC (DUF456 family)
MRYYNKLTLAKAILIISAIIIGFTANILYFERVGGSKAAILLYSLLGVMILLGCIALFIDLYDIGIIDRIGRKLKMESSTVDRSVKNI